MICVPIVQEKKIPTLGITSAGCRGIENTNAWQMMFPAVSFNLVLSVYKVYTHGPKGWAAEAKPVNNLYA